MKNDFEKIKIENEISCIVLSFWKSIMNLNKLKTAV